MAGVVVGRDDEDVLDAAAEGGDLGAAGAELERLEGPREVGDEVGAVVAAQRRPHHQPPVLVAACRVDRQLVRLRRQQQRAALRRDRRRLPLQLLHVLYHLRQQRRLIRLSHYI